MNNDYLAHYGVLGMKWGVRKYQNKDGSLTPAGRRRQNSDKNAKLNVLTTRSPDKNTKLDRLTTKKDKAKDMSDEELKTKIDRLRLEKQYKDLTPGGFKKGMAIAGVILSAGTTVASIYALKNSPLGRDAVGFVRRAASSQSYRSLENVIRMAQGG